MKIREQPMCRATGTRSREPTGASVNLTQRVAAGLDDRLIDEQDPRCRKCGSRRE